MGGRITCCEGTSKRKESYIEANIISVHDCYQIRSSKTSDFSKNYEEIKNNNDTYLQNFEFATQRKKSIETKESTQIMAKQDILRELNKTPSIKSCVTNRSSYRFGEVENFKVLSLSPQVIESMKLSKWLSSVALHSKVIHEGLLYKYSCVANKTTLVPRYCKIGLTSLKYYHNKIQSEEWLAKPIVEIKISNIEQVNRIMFEDKRITKCKDGFEILMKWPKDKQWNNFDVYHAIFGCEDKAECLKWIMLVKHLIAISQDL